MPIFLLNGDKLVDDYHNLWDGTVDVPLNVNELGDYLNQNYAWTGSDSFGTKFKPLSDANFASHRIGKVQNTDSTWIEGGLLTRLSPESLYALSGTLTVPTSEPIPEPSTLVLFGLGFLGLVGYVYRRKRRLSD